MSSILKALEKAEESHRVKRLPGEGDLIRSRRPRPSWVLPAAVLGGACAATLVTFLAMGGFSRRAPAPFAPVLSTRGAIVSVEPLNPVPESRAPALRQSAPVGGAGPSTSHPPSAPATTPKAAASSPPASKTGKAPLDQSAAARVKMMGASPGASKVAQPTVAIAGATATAAHPSAPPAAAQGGPASLALAPAIPRPELKVTGIAWQGKGKGESSFAVVNGRAVLQGSTVDGFKVLEIQKDMVRFSGSNGNVDVPLGEDEK